MRFRALPLITIGMPTKNAACHIRKVLQAVESSQYLMEKTKLVFVDDYSTDGTFEILTEWKTRMEKQYYGVILIQERSNIPQARNLCIRHMEGKHLLFWDSDIIPPRELLKQMVSTLESESKVGIIGSDYSYQHRNVHISLLGEPVTNKATHAVYMGFTLIRREVFERVGEFNGLLDVGEDTEFGMRVAEKTEYKIMWAPRPVLHLRTAEKRRFSFVSWLSYNFYVRGRQYAETFRKLPLLLRLRIFYYALLPLILAFSLFSAFYMGSIWMLSVLIAYLMPGLFFSVYVSNIRRGTISFFTSKIPTGIALSLGVLISVLKRLLRR